MWLWTKPLKYSTCEHENDAIFNLWDLKQQPFNSGVMLGDQCPALPLPPGGARGFLQLLTWSVASRSLWASMRSWTRAGRLCLTARCIGEVPRCGRGHICQLGVLPSSGWDSVLVGLEPSSFSNIQPPNKYQGCCSHHMAKRARGSGPLHPPACREQVSASV